MAALANCTAGSDGDAYCQSLFRELVLGGGRVTHVGCKQFFRPCDTCSGHEGQCTLDYAIFYWTKGSEGAPVCDIGYIPVDRGQGERCERPCAEPQ